MQYKNLSNDHQKKLFINAQDFFSEWSKKELIEKILEDMTIEQAQNLYDATHEETDEEILERKAEEQYEYSKDETILEYLDSLDQ